jgi:hypothetical protein
MGFATRSLRRSLPIVVVVAAWLMPAARASTPETILDDAALAQLETRAQAAQPREQCFLYVELVHNLTEIAGKQIADGDTLSAGTTLKRIDTLAQKIHMSLARDTRRLKNAELLLHHTTHRLADMLHVAAGEDAPTVQSTLKRLDIVQNEILAAVFTH